MLHRIGGPGSYEREVPLFIGNQKKNPLTMLVHRIGAPLHWGSAGEMNAYNGGQ